MAVADLCNRYPQGVLYHEVREPESFVKSLARAVNMKIEGSNVIDLFLAYLRDSFVVFHKLPESPRQGIKYVISTVENAAVRFQKKHGKMPVLFLDGIDLVVKYDEKLFGALVTQAKGLSNRGTLRVVFVSSDGSVIPLLQKYAAINRMDTIKEVLDISSEDVLKYLAHFGITGSKANRIVNLVGGRLAYLSTS